MALWDKTSTKPQHLNAANSRNVIATDQGWVRRIAFTDAGGSGRIKDEILVPIGGLANSTNMGFPNITEMYHSRTTGTVPVVVTTYVVFDEPVYRLGSGTFTLAVANTVSGNTITAFSDGVVVGSNNQLAFEWRATAAGTYKVQSQLASNTRPILSHNSGNETANLYILPAASNGAGSVVLTA